MRLVTDYPDEPVENTTPGNAEMSGSGARYALVSKA
jgi:hypothetical protein